MMRVPSIIYVSHANSFLCTDSHRHTHVILPHREKVEKAIHFSHYENSDSKSVSSTSYFFAFWEVNMWRCSLHRAPFNSPVELTQGL